MWLKTAYWAGMIAEIFIRAPFAKLSQSRQRVEQRISRTEQSLLALLGAGGFLLPLIYSITSWLDFADYHLPVWLGWLGVLFLAGSLFLFARGHIDLKSNWSQSLEIYDRHDLVTGGIYNTLLRCVVFTWANGSHLRSVGFAPFSGFPFRMGTTRSIYWRNPPDM